MDTRPRWAGERSGRNESGLKAGAAIPSSLVANAEGFSLRSVSAGPVGSPILQNITVDLPPVGITVIAGPSGSGKTTLLRLLNRLDDPLAGDISWRGQPLAAVDPQELRRQVATVFQRPPLFPGTVLENFRVAESEVDEAQAVHVLDHVGLPAELLHRSATALSGGEAQRMTVARALLTRPSVILADEPTASLDVDARLAIEALAHQLADEGQSIIWVSHDTDQLRRLATHVVVIVDGEVAAFGSVADLDASDNPVVRRLVGAPR